MEETLCPVDFAEDVEEIVTNNILILYNKELLVAGYSKENQTIL